LVLQKRDQFLIDAFAPPLDLGDHALEVVTGGQLDDDEDDQADREQRRDHDQQATDDVGQHGLAASRPRPPRGCQNPHR
jgi:hypothetical protein